MNTLLYHFPGRKETKSIAGTSPLTNQHQAANIRDFTGGRIRLRISQVQRPPGCLKKPGHIDSESGHGGPGMLRITALPVGRNRRTVRLALAEEFPAGASGIGPGPRKTRLVRRLLNGCRGFVESLKNSDAFSGKKVRRGNVASKDKGLMKGLQQRLKPGGPGHVGRAVFGKPVVGAARFPALVGQTGINDNVSGGDKRGAVCARSAGVLN
jgi:hypothetical protein